MDEQLSLRYETADKQAIKKLAKNEQRDFSDMARLVIKDGIKARKKK